MASALALYLEAAIEMVIADGDECLFATVDDMLDEIYNRLVARFGDKIICVLSSKRNSYGMFFSAQDLDNAPPDGSLTYDDKLDPIPVFILLETRNKMDAGEIGMVIDRGAEWQSVCIKARPTFQ